ncbi:MAG: hypothetical protein JNK82_15390 [Myxococcaceae bacterium]|nr:hypothetical protein [Myxococcaceae bacterium]
MFELNAGDVRYLVVGGYAFFFHASPRYTKDLDIWVEASAENAPRVMQALQQFGAPLHGLSLDDLSRPGITFQMGLPPNRIDVLTDVTAVTFDEAWARRVEANYGDQRMWVLSKQDLIANKRTVGRPRDLEDVAELEKI